MATKTVLYSDNGCDLDQDRLEGLGVRMFGLPVMIKETTYVDRVTIAPPEFYRLLAQPGTVATTSQVNIATFVQEFASVLQEENTEILYLAFSGGLSGTYESACMARDMVDPQRITVIDTRSASVGQGLTVVKAAQALAAGQGKAEVIIAAEDNINRMEHIFIVGNLEMLKRGGRINPAAATIGDLLNIKVILQMKDGKIVPLEKNHGLKKAKRQLLDIMAERGGDLRNQTIGISYSQDRQGALEIRDMIEARFGVDDFLISEIGALIGSHVGAGTYAVYFLRP
ncbi:MAG: DegV family protein [Syntrophomonadaceae bacterium]